jgi:hypothetical protein
MTLVRHTQTRCGEAFKSTAVSSSFETLAPYTSPNCSGPMPHYVTGPILVQCTMGLTCNSRYQNAANLDHQNCIGRIQQLFLFMAQTAGHASTLQGTAMISAHAVLSCRLAQGAPRATHGKVYSKVVFKFKSNKLLCICDQHRTCDFTQRNRRTEQ